MDDKAIKLCVNQTAAAIEGETEVEQGMDRMCRLLDAKEYLRRAWHALDGTLCIGNDTSIEAARRKRR